MKLVTLINEVLHESSRQPGDVWQTSKGWGAKSPDGDVEYFYGTVGKDTAETFAKGGHNDVTKSWTDSPVSGPDGSDYMQNLQGSYIWDLPYEVSTGVEMYTGSSTSDRVNRYLRFGEDLTDKDLTVIESMDRAFDTAPKTTRPLAVFRGVDGGATGFAGTMLNMEPGTVFEDEGYVSTSLTDKTARNFAGRDGVVLKIDVPSGEQVLYMGDSWNEEEVVLRRRTRFEITGIDRSSRTVSVRVLTDHDNR
jgi:hypothetical protein